MNGQWIGVHANPGALLDSLIHERRVGAIKEEVSIVRDIREKELRIYTDAGRVMRPLFVVDRNKQTINVGPRDIEKLRNSSDAKARAAETSTSGLNLGVPQYGWTDLIANGKVEYLDAEEEETSMIAMELRDLEDSRNSVQDDGTMKREAETAPAVDSTAGARIRTKTFSHTFTHCEIHPSMILGVCASIIPFPDHNQVSGRTVVPKL